MKLPLLAAALLCSASLLAAQDLRPATRLRSIAIDRAPDGSVLVVIQADGALHPPESGVLAAPPRIFFDFPELLPAPKGATGQGNPAVRQVRVALHSAAPRVTRVVIDLVQATPYRLEASGDPTRFVVAINGAASAAPSPAPAPIAKAPPRLAPTVARVKEVSRPAPAPEVEPPPTPEVVPDAASPPPPPPDPKPAAPAAGGQRSADGAQDQLVEIVDRFEKLRPVLAAIDGRNPAQAVDLQLAAAELSSMAKAVTAIKYTPRTNRTQGRLVQACALASQAVKARIESEATGNTALGWTAASAAAGTLLMLDAARAELGLPPVAP